MPGPKYVTDFEFPSSFGFSRSAGDSVAVRGHDRARPRFAEGGRVRKRPLTPTERAGIEAENKPRKGERVSTLDTMRGGTRRQRERELGLAMGGPVHAAKGGAQVVVDKAIKKHVRAPKPRGHGVR